MNWLHSMGRADISQSYFLYYKERDKAALGKNLPFGADCRRPTRIYGEKAFWQICTDTASSGVTVYKVVKSAILS